jgi:hypothetical protein
MIEDAGKFRPTEMRDVTCYLPKPFIRGGRSAKRLSARIQHLRHLAETERVQGVVLEIVLFSMEDEIAELEKYAGQKVFDFEGEYDADSVLNETKGAINQMKKQFELDNQESTDE